MTAKAGIPALYVAWLGESSYATAAVSGAGKGMAVGNRAGHTAWHAFLSAQL